MLYPRQSISRSFNPHWLWTFYTLLGPRRINFKMFCLKTPTKDALLRAWYKASIILEGIKEKSIHHPE